MLTGTLKMAIRQMAILAIGSLLAGPATAAPREIVVLDPLSYQTPIHWFDAVDKASTSKGFRVAGKALGALGSIQTFGLRNMEMRSLPTQFESVGKDNLAFKVYHPSWTLPPYATARGEEKPEQALSDWCLPNGGVVVETGSDQWACEREGRFLAVVEHRKREALLAVFITVMQPLSDSVNEQAQFTESMVSAGIKTAAMKAAAISIREARYDRAQSEQRAQSGQRRQVGTRICKMVNSGHGHFYIYSGFVEAKSPDLDRVKIQVTERTVVRGDVPSIREPQSQSIWDNPDNWHVCE